MVARNRGLACFSSLKITHFLRQTFLKDFKAIWLNHQKVTQRLPVPRDFLKLVPLLVPTVLLSNKYRYHGTFRKYRAHFLKRHVLSVNVIRTFVII